MPIETPFVFPGLFIPVTAKQLASPNHYRGRGGHPVDTVVLHYDASRRPSSTSTAQVFASARREASAHLCIGDAVDDVTQCVDLEDAAWHAGDGGRARMPTTQQLNALAPGAVVPLREVPVRAGVMNRRSIGIEQRNRGWAPRGPRPYGDARHRNPASTSTRWETWGSEQIATLARVLTGLVDEVPTLRWITGHEDLTHADTLGKPGGKLDPGPLFPWEALPILALGLRRVFYDFAARGWGIAGTGEVR